MNITDIRIRKTYNESRLRALVSITIDRDLAVHDIKIIEGPTRLFVAMPSRKDESGTFRDVVHPITPEARAVMEESILGAYHNYLAMQEVDRQESGHQQGEHPSPSSSLRPSASAGPLDGSSQFFS